MRTEKRFIGDIGEEVACRFLKKKGYNIIERNYLKKWGEIDIIARKSGELHFVEVKTVQSKVESSKSKNVSQETEGYRPEENVHPAKLKRLARTVETYLLDKGVSDSVPWQIDVVTVLLDLKDKKAKVDMLENVIL
ncbi:YraN family protein [Candidatus Wolfebacteria bacterium]|nr:YraN family protein [Candidatus Wolfebacteria bacterium]